MGAIPPPPHRYLDVDLPERFVLEVQDGEGGWVDYGLYHADRLVRCDDGSYFCQPGAGSPIYLRCLDQHGDVIHVVDGVGEHFLYELVQDRPGRAAALRVARPLIVDLIEVHRRMLRVDDPKQRWR